jgi:two-component system chemotaxis sensor kinase CheA
MITIEDDGAGIDIERLKNAAVQKGLVTEADVAIMPDDKAIDLIFQSGLSTAKKITDVSGRGVGMDIVRNNIEHVNGSIQVETWPGRGTQFQIILPLTLAIVPTLLVRVENNTFAIPLASVTETRRVGKDEISTVRNNPVILLRNKVLTLVSLAYVFGLPVSKQDKQYQYIVVVNSGKTQIGLMVDTLVGEEEVVVKSMGALIGDIPGVSSAAILGDGQVALIADIQGLYKLSGIH